MRTLPRDAAGKLARLGLVSRGFQQKQRNTKAPMYVPLRRSSRLITEPSRIQTEHIHPLQPPTAKLFEKRPRRFPQLPSIKANKSRGLPTNSLIGEKKKKNHTFPDSRSYLRGSTLRKRVSVILPTSRMDYQSSRKRPGLASGFPKSENRMPGARSI